MRGCRSPAPLGRPGRACRGCPRLSPALCVPLPSAALCVPLPSAAICVPRRGPLPHGPVVTAPRPPLTVGIAVFPAAGELRAERAAGAEPAGLGQRSALGGFAALWHLWVSQLPCEKHRASILLRSALGTSMPRVRGGCDSVITVLPTPGSSLLCLFLQHGAANLLRQAGEAVLGSTELWENAHPGFSGFPSPDAPKYVLALESCTAVTVSSKIRD